jgi:acyl transferase domain-containing protein
MAFVFLKKLSHVIADGNPILAIVLATAVYKNLTNTPLFVPKSISLSHLFKDIIQAANLEANGISLVEVHGTGTPVGDPAEYESMRGAFGGPIRKKPLPFGSVKGHIGHTKGSSGIIASVKVIIMMRHGFMPVQAIHNYNPVGQKRKAMSPVLAVALDIPSDRKIPLSAWIKRLRRSPYFQRWRTQLHAWLIS